MSARAMGEDTCALCGKGRKAGEEFRDVRNIHVHWARVMELCCPRRYLSEWGTRKHYYAHLPRVKLEKHFKCFTHEDLSNTFRIMDSGKRCHKHCLHAFNFTVKVRFDEFQQDTEYEGPKPDVRARPPASPCNAGRGFTVCPPPPPRRSSSSSAKRTCRWIR